MVHGLVWVVLGTLGCGWAAAPPHDPAARPPSAASPPGPALAQAADLHPDDPAAIDAAEPADPVDRIFTRYVKQLAPVTTADRCFDARSLPSLAELVRQVPLYGDDDLATLVPWLRYPDRCIRQIAIEAVVLAIAFKCDPPWAEIGDPEDWQYHRLFVYLKRYLRDKHVNFAPEIFDGMHLTVYKYELTTSLVGSWGDAVRTSNAYGRRLEITAASIGFEYLVARTTATGSHPVARKIKQITITELGQFVVLLADPPGRPPPTGPPPWRADEGYVIWPVADDVLWIRVIDPPSDWIKLRRRSV
jgi:hypothetical protein